MRPAEWLQEVGMKRFEEAYDGWIEKRLSQEEAARILGVSDRTFRRYVERYDDGGQEALVDRRLSQTSHSKAPVVEVMALTQRYRARHDGWSARHFHTWYTRRWSAGVRGEECADSLVGRPAYRPESLFQRYSDGEYHLYLVYGSI